MKKIQNLDELMSVEEIRYTFELRKYNCISESINVT